MAHRDGDTEATIDSAIADGRRFLEEVAAEIAAERGLPDDWLDRLGKYALPEPQPPSEDNLTMRQRAVMATLRVVVRVSARCVAVAREPDTGRLKKCCALGGLDLRKAVLALLRLPGRRNHAPSQRHDNEPEPDS